MRKCKGRYYKKGEWIEFSLGYFHQWGCDYEEYESGAGNYSIAIVELPNGNVISVVPSELQFIDLIND